MKWSKEGSRLIDKFNNTYDEFKTQRGEETKQNGPPYLWPIAKRKDEEEYKQDVKGDG
jgi:hypothetical protein